MMGKPVRCPRCRRHPTLYREGWLHVVTFEGLPDGYADTSGEADAQGPNGCVEARCEKCHRWWRLRVRQITEVQRT